MNFTTPVADRGHYYVKGLCNECGVRRGEKPTDLVTHTRKDGSSFASTEFINFLKDFKHGH